MCFVAERLDRSHLPAAERHKLWETVVDANKANAAMLNDIAYDALAAGELDAALTAAKRQVELNKTGANGYDMLAEVHHYRREKAEALAREDQAFELLKDNKDNAMNKLAMQANRARYAADQFAAESGVTAIKRRVAELWKRVGSVERREAPDAMSDKMSEIMASMNAHRAAKNALLTDTGKLCVSHAGKLTEAYVRIDLDGTTPAITVLEPDASAALKQCLVDNLRKATYPKRPLGMAAKSVDRVPLKDDPMPGMH